MKKQVNKLLSILVVVSTISIMGVGLVSLDNKYKDNQMRLLDQINYQEQVINDLIVDKFHLQNELYVSLSELIKTDNEFEAYREQFEEWEMLVVQATAYSNDPISATGTVPTVGRTIAVDPRVIPLGSEVYVEGFGWRIAEDTGGLIKGNIIDIYMNNRTETRAWGRRNGIRILVKKSVDSDE